MHRKFISEKLKEGDHSEDQGVDTTVILDWILGKQCWRLWTGFIWLGIGTSGGLL
jgi:hypothetical protein